MKETIAKAAERAGWNEKWGKLAPMRGIGIGTNSVQTGFSYGNPRRFAGPHQIQRGWRATVISGVVDNGQGNDNMLVQIAAEELGIRPRTCSWLPLILR